MHPHAPMHPCTHAPMHPCTHAPMHLCTYAPMLPCTQCHPVAPMHLCTHAPMHPCIHAPMRPCTHAPMHPCIHCDGNNDPARPLVVPTTPTTMPLVHKSACGMAVVAAGLTRDPTYPHPGCRPRCHCARHPPSRQTRGRGCSCWRPSHARRPEPLPGWWCCRTGG